MANNKPTATLSDGRSKATIWKQNSDKGDFFRVTFSRSYKDEAGNWHDSDSFSGTELLRLAHLATKAFDQTNDLRQSSRDENEVEATPADGRPSCPRLASSAPPVFGWSSISASQSMLAATS